MCRSRGGWSQPRRPGCCPGDGPCGVLGCWRHQTKVRLCWDAFPAPHPRRRCARRPASLLRQKKPLRRLPAPSRILAACWGYSGWRGGGDLTPPATSTVPRRAQGTGGDTSIPPQCDTTGCLPCPQNLGWSRRAFGNSRDGLARHRKPLRPTRGVAKSDPKAAAGMGQLQTPPVKPPPLRFPSQRLLPAL